MKYAGTTTIRAPRERVWAFLTDPEAVASCAPGVESVEVVESGRRFRASASAGFGAVRLRFATEAEWVTLEPPARATMTLHGSAPGSALDGTTSMELADRPDGGTELSWTAHVAIAGTIASLAARLMGGVVARLTREFFECIGAKIEEREAVPRD